ncbi:PQQ-dependent sugar dehydrogenase [Candidatus Nitrosotenuis cloacae]|uniref:PQQ-dependent sugar dehydrogenase n=1 Tax=Candidatus Nitrosotenuis cloacae TaxID=1603555 RepID=UPI002A4E1A7F|nr:PQQ-dependent sugar dehydrogenase [Candidatus Nitrosotenuis cloacae]
MILGMAVGILPAFAEPQINDNGLIVETYMSGIPDNPTSMAFVGDDILVLQRYNGQVRLIQDGIMQDRPVLDVSVAKDGERGMLGITTVGSTVYIYFTASDTDGGEAIENRIYKYTWNGHDLVDPVLLKTLPSENYYHNGGAMTNFDGQVYAVIGDNGNYGRLQNRPFDWKNDTSVILRVDPPGPYYAIGVRNSFGLAVDPFTGNLWDTENGDDENDEINLVPDRFNSGWIEIMGPAKNQEQIDALPKYEDYAYSDPEFTWQKPVAPTGISFLKSDRMKNYEDSVFVGDCNTGNIYRFKLNSERTGFVFDTPELSDNMLNEGDPSDEIIFGTNFGCVTDVEAGPDGLLYFVSLSEGKIFRVMPNVLAQGAESQDGTQQGGGCLIATAAYGTETASQVQMLREIRDGVMFGTSSGAAFMSGFNSFYYTFSPTVADMERQSPVFKEAVRIAITPMLSTLSILSYADIDSESEMIGYGIGIILLNAGLYIVAPALAIVQLRRVLR